MNDLTIIIPEGDEEPRLLDTDLAERLGMAEPRKVRQNVIDPNRAELESLGPLLMKRIQTGGRPAIAYYLNEQQAFLVASLSRTERAKEVRAMLIRVFVAYRQRGGNFAPY